MQEMGIETNIMKQVLSGQKTVEPRLKSGKFLTMRKGDIVSLREDVWENEIVIKSTPGRAQIKIEETLFFDDFDALFAAIPFKQVVPPATSVQEAIQAHRQFYTPSQEREHGIIAIRFSLV